MADGHGPRAEVAQVVAHLERATSTGVGATHMFEGEAGIGKTTVLAAVAAEASGLGFTVLGGTGSVLDRARPFGPLLDALALHPKATEVDAGRAHRTRRSPLQTVPGDRAATIERLTDAVEARLAAAPVLLMIDDLHWADPSTLAAFAHLHRTTAEQPLVLVGALRPVPRDPELDELVTATRRAGAVVHVLGPLDDAEVHRLVEEAAGGEPGPGLTQAAARAGGNPFLVLELVRALEHTDRLVVADGTAELAGDATGIGVDEVRAAIVDRMTDLGPDARHVLRIAAALAPSFSLSDLAAVLGRPPGAVLPSVETAIAAGLLADDGRTLGFRHDVVREVVAGTIGATALAALHLDIARTLAAAGAPAGRVATHYALGAEPGDATAVEWLRAAAADIVATAPTSAAELLERALDVCPAGDPQHDAVLAELVDAAFWGGDVDRAADLARRALARPLDATIAASLHETMARALVLIGRPGEAVAHAQELAGLGDQAAWAAALESFFRVFALDLDGAAAAAQRAIELAAADGVDDCWAEALALGVLSWESNARGFHEPGVALATRAVEAADRSPGGEAHRLIPHLFRGMSLESCGRSDEAAATLEHGRLLADRLGTTWARPFYRYVSALPHWNAGRWDEVLTECEAGLRDAREHEVALAASWACAIAATAHLFRDERTAAAALLDEGDARLAAGGLQFGADWLLRARALLLEAEGDLAGALELLRFGWEVAEGLQAAAALVVIAPDLVRIAVEAGELEVARAAAAALDRGEVDASRLNIDAHARRCRGLAELDLDAIAEARSLHEQCSRPVEVVQDDEARVLTLLRLGRIDEAGIALTECTARCQQLDMPFVAERVRQSAARLGLARPRRRAARGVTGWESLTETERLVAGLVAVGRTNPQVATELLISRRTVESHLYRIYFKLGVSNRTELAVVAMRNAPVR